MWRNLASNMLTLLVVALVALAGVIAWGQSQYVAQGPLDRAICLQVPSGGSMTRVADDLAEKGAISNPTIYRLGADYSGLSPQLKAGSFLIEPGASMEQIVAKITGDGRSTCGTEILYIVAVNGQEKRVRELDPETQEFVVTAAFDPKDEGEVPAEYTAALEDVATQFRLVVVEGVTSWQVVEGLKATEILEGEVAEVPPEGSLAPREFAIRPGTDRNTLLAEMAAQQEEWLADAWAARSSDAAVETPEEALILASIIEKETSLAEERPLVASVFTNRLKQGIKLQTDPTVIYGVTEGKGVLGRGLRRSELRARTPWNTYVIDGLPPTPIANPGRASIEAALNPDTSEYIFFVAKSLDPRDGHNFAVTLDEHNRNVAAYRALERAAE
ncbi:MAG: endolytic transglycosylase MltG [Pseudomonadota bacterium]